MVTQIVRSIRFGGDAAEKETRSAKFELTLVSNFCRFLRSSAGKDTGHLSYPLVQEQDYIVTVPRRRTASAPSAFWFHEATIWSSSGNNTQHSHPGQEGCAHRVKSPIPSPIVPCCVVIFSRKDSSNHSLTSIS